MLENILIMRFATDHTITKFSWFVLCYLREFIASSRTREKMITNLSKTLQQNNFSESYILCYILHGYWFMLKRNSYRLFKNLISSTPGHPRRSDSCHRLKATVGKLWEIIASSRTRKKTITSLSKTFIINITSNLFSFSHNCLKF